MSSFNAFYRVELESAKKHLGVYAAGDWAVGAPDDTPIARDGSYLGSCSMACLATSRAHALNSRSVLSDR